MTTTTTPRYSTLIPEPLMSSATARATFNAMHTAILVELAKGAHLYAAATHLPLELRDGTRRIAIVLHQTAAALHDFALIARTRDVRGAELDRASEEAYVLTDLGARALVALLLAKVGDAEGF